MIVLLLFFMNIFLKQLCYNVDMQLENNMYIEALRDPKTENMAKTIYVSINLLFFVRVFFDLYAYIPMVLFIYINLMNQMIYLIYQVIDKQYTNPISKYRLETKKYLVYFLFIYYYYMIEDIFNITTIISLLFIGNL